MRIFDCATGQQMAKRSHAMIDGHAFFQRDIVITCRNCPATMLFVGRVASQDMRTSATLRSWLLQHRCLFWWVKMHEINLNRYLSPSSSCLFCIRFAHDQTHAEVFMLFSIASNKGTNKKLIFKTISSHRPPDLSRVRLERRSFFLLY